MPRISITTPPAIISYPSLFAPRLSPDGSEKFGCCLIFPKGTDLAELEAALREAAVDRFGSKALQQLKDGRLRWPLRDGSERPGRPGYEPGAKFINVSSKLQPGVVDKYAGSGGRPRPIDNPDLVYPGALCRASVTPFGYSVSGNSGVSALLNAIQVLDTDERRYPRIDGRPSAEWVFDALEDEPADFADVVEDDEDDDDRSVTERLKDAARRSQRRRIHRRDGDAEEPWDDAAA
jgi:hypothetical protein